MTLLDQYAQWRSEGFTVAQALGKIIRLIFTQKAEHER
jgi:hypothetical protein